MNLVWWIVGAFLMGGCAGMLVFALNPQDAEGRRSRQRGRGCRGSRRSWADPNYTRSGAAGISVAGLHQPLCTSCAAGGTSLQRGAETSLGVAEPSLKSAEINARRPSQRRRPWRCQRKRSCSAPGLPLPPEPAQKP